MTYAGDVRNISHHVFSNRAQLLVGDVADLDFCRRVVKDACLVIHAAAARVRRGTAPPQLDAVPRRGGLEPGRRKRAHQLGGHGIVLQATRGEGVV